MHHGLPKIGPFSGPFTLWARGNVPLVNPPLVVTTSRKNSNLFCKDLAYGTCRDWAYEVAGVPLSFTFELPGFGFGFSPPIEKIAPVVTETWEAIKVLACKASDAEKRHTTNNLTKHSYL